MYIFVCLCKFKNFEQKSYFKKNVIAIAIAQNVPLYGQTLIILLVVSFSSQINLFAQNEVKDTNQFALNAISKAVIQFHQQKYVGYKQYRVITMKIMEINNTSGEFVLSFIFWDLKDLNPTHYVHVNNELVLIIIDSLCNSDDLEMYGICKITEVIKKEALGILPGPGISITGSDPSKMVFKYDRNKLEGKFYDGYNPPALDKKYSF